MSPEHSEIRKSLESIQSMLSRGGDDHQRSSTTASSLSSRVHRSSAEAGEGGSAGGGRSASSVSFGGGRIATDDDAGGVSSSVIRRSHSSAFSAVNKFMTIGGGGGVLSPSPFNGDERTGGLGVAPRSSAAWGGRETSLRVSTTRDCLTCWLLFISVDADRPRLAGADPAPSSPRRCHVNESLCPHRSTFFCRRPATPLPSSNAEGAQPFQCFLIVVCWCQCSSSSPC